LTGRARSHSVNVATPMMWDKPPPAAPLKHNIKWADLNAVHGPVFSVALRLAFDSEEREMFDEMLRIRDKTALAPPTLLERRRKPLWNLDLDTEENNRLQDNPPRPYRHPQQQAHYQTPFRPSAPTQPQPSANGYPVPGAEHRHFNPALEHYMQVSSQPYRRLASQLTETVPNTRPVFSDPRPPSNPQSHYCVPRLSDLSDREREQREYSTRIAALQEKRLESEGSTFIPSHKSSLP